MFLRFRGFKMRSKLLLSYLIVVLLPVSIIGYLLLDRTIDSVRVQHELINDSDAKQLAANIRNKLMSYLNFAENAASDQMLMNYLEMNNSTGEDLIERIKEFRYVTNAYANQFILTDENVSIRFYSDNPTIIKDEQTIYALTGQVKRFEWYRDIQSSGASYVLVPTYRNEQEEPVITIARKLDSNRSIYTNYIIMDVQESNIFDLFAEEGEPGYKQVYVVEPQGHLVSASHHREYLGMPAHRVPYLHELAGESGMQQEEEFRSNQQVIKIKSGGHHFIKDWDIIVVYSLDAMLDHTYGVVRSGLLIIAACLVAALLLMNYFSNKLTFSLKQLVRNMSGIRDGHFEVYLDTRRSDEIGDLSRSFRSMIERIQRLIGEVYSAELHKKQAELHALQSQIKPHFLFNALESIQSGLLLKEDASSASSIRSLAKLLRKSIDWQEDMVPLSWELELIQDYLAIQKLRYPHKLSYRVEVEESLLALPIPKFTIQPLVENAVYHGIERSVEPGEVVITAKKEASHVLIHVADQGAGMSPSRLDELTRLLEGASGGVHVGLRNVHQRLKHIFGEKYGIAVDSRPGEGTIVTVRMPIPEES